MLGSLLFVVTPIFAQIDLADSSDLGQDDALYYDVEKTRLVRWLRLHKNEMTADLFNQVIELIKEAQNFAKEGDYETGLLLLDSASDLAKSSSSQAAILPEGSENSIRPMAGEPAGRWSWKPGIVTGMDFWRQEFDLGFSGEASTYFESSWNPFVGLRLRGNYEGASLSSFETYLLGKVSRDYYSGEASVRGLFGSLQRGHFLFDNRFEATDYRNGLSLKYLENRTTLQAGVELARNFVFLAGNEFQIRNYAEQSELYPNYFQNLIYGGLQYTSGLATRLAAQYNFGFRRHSHYLEDDFREHRIEASVYQTTAINSSIFFQNIWRDRKYVHGDVDSSYQNSYQEEYFRADFRFGLSHWASFDLQGDFTLRQHPNASLYTPDFVDVRANPRFLFRLIGDLQLGLGYLFTLRVYKQDIIRTTPAPVPTANAAASQQYLGYEDYFSHGASLSLELFRLGSFMMSLTDQFELRTYPNSPTNDINGFGLYTDRAINSILMFLSWQILPQMDFGLMINYDDDRGRKVENSDTRNSLFSLDLGYSF